MAKHAHAAAEAAQAASQAATNGTAAADAAAQGAALPKPIWEWSISEAWNWLGHAWINAIHTPYLGLLALALLFVVGLRVLVKLLR